MLIAKSLSSEKTLDFGTVLGPEDPFGLLKYDKCILCDEMDMSPWGPAECYGVNVKCPPQANIFDICSSAGDAVWGGRGTFWTMDLAGFFYLAMCTCDFPWLWSVYIFLLLSGISLCDLVAFEEVSCLFPVWGSAEQ